MMTVRVILKFSSRFVNWVTMACYEFRDDIINIIIFMKFKLLLLG